MVLATPRYAATSSGKGRTSPGFGRSRGLRSRDGRSTKFEDVLRAAVPRPAEPTDWLRLVDVHGSVGQDRVVHVQSNRFTEEDRVVRDRDGPDEAALEVHGRLGNPRGPDGVGGGGSQARFFEFTDVCGAVAGGD